MRRGDNGGGFVSDHYAESDITEEARSSEGATAEETGDPSAAPTPDDATDETGSAVTDRVTADEVESTAADETAAESRVEDNQPADAPPADATASGVTDGEPASDERAEQGGGVVSLPTWRYAPDAWRWIGRTDLRQVNLAFRAGSARMVPSSLRSRIVALGLPPDVVDTTLGRIRRAQGWSDGWIELAQRYLGDFRRQQTAGNILDAGKTRKLAALCYHVAQIFELQDERTITKCRAAAASLFTQSLPQCYSNVRHIWVPWRGASLPAYLRIPEPLDHPVGMVVMLNGITISKEETLCWSERFLDAGLAVLCIDSPGTGEATGHERFSASHDDILDGVFGLFQGEPLLDLERIAVLGVSLGGSQAVRCLARESRALAGVAITPPWMPSAWLHRASPLLKREIVMLGGVEPDNLDAEAAAFDLDTVVSSVAQPLLVFGGGKDVVVPPAESQRLAAACGTRATLAWYPAGGHCLSDANDHWTFDAATWIRAVFDAAEAGERDAVALADAGRDALAAADYVPTVPESSLDDAGHDLTEYARLLPSRKAETAEPNEPG